VSPVRGSPLVGKIAESLLKKLNEREFQTTMDNIKARIEAEAAATMRQK